jgi:AcrR family transcriptional regulator
MDPRLQSPRVGDGGVRTRILEGALGSVRADGMAGFSLRQVGLRAGVSKALVLYYFASRDALLATLIEWLTSRVVARETAAIWHGGSILDDLWHYLAAEADQGELPALLELATAKLPLLRSAGDASASRRQAQAETTVERVYQRLELSPSLPLQHVAWVEQAFREGLIRGMDRGRATNPRAAFDVFRLGLLSQST